MASTANQQMLQRMDFPLILSCPFCQHGSAQLYSISADLSPWDDIDCPVCGERFSKSAAVDEMFVRGDVSGISLWTSGVQVAGTGHCKQGQTALLDIRNVFDQIYRIVPSRAGSHLAGGFKTTYIRQGYIMISLAPALSTGSQADLPVLVQVSGRPYGANELSTWRAFLLEARQVALDAPKLSVILCVSALDLFFEELSGGTAGNNRPNSWNRLLQRRNTDLSLADIMNDRFQLLKMVVNVRNAYAHGRNHVSKLPADIASEEQRWLKTGDCYEDWEAPSSQFALRTTLDVVRSVQERLDLAR